MASEEPLFDPSLKKKKKKKTVAFNEDPLGADADPTFSGAQQQADAADPGPTLHEQMVQNDLGREEPAAPKEEDPSAMFADLKKKKKKKDIPMDLVRHHLLKFICDSPKTRPGRGRLWRQYTNTRACRSH